MSLYSCVGLFFFFKDTATTEIYTYGHTLSLHEALPISVPRVHGLPRSVTIPRSFRRTAISRSALPSTKARYIHRTVSASSGGPGTSTTRSVWMLLCSPRASSALRSEEHTSELQSLMRISYAVFCLKKKKQQTL